MARAVVVLGMHRSGTSLLMQVLASCGLRVGTVRRDPVPDNERGYWEHEEIMVIQDRLVRDLGADWDGPHALSLPANWLARGEVREARESLLRIVRRETSLPGLWGFKDPRTLLFLPMWQGIFQAADVRPDFVLALRWPADTIASLAERDGLTVEAAEAVWRAYFIASAAVQMTAVVQYEIWFENPRETVRYLCDRLRLNDPDADAIAALVDPALRHQARAPMKMKSESW